MFLRLFSIFVIFAVAFLPAACATKKSLKKEVTRIDQEIDTLIASVEDSETRLKEHDSRISDQDQRLSDLSAESREALERAENAETLAQGKLIYEIVLSDESVKFGFDKAEVSDSMKTVLDDLVTQLKSENKNVYIEIQGFTDSVGPREYNLQLGLERAEAVRRYLSEAGIPLHRISTISYGEERPVSTNGTKNGRSQNRRVVIQVLA